MYTCIVCSHDIDTFSYTIKARQAIYCQSMCLYTRLAFDRLILLCTVKQCVPEHVTACSFYHDTVEELMEQIRLLLATIIIIINSYTQLCMFMGTFSTIRSLHALLVQSSL